MPDLLRRRALNATALRNPLRRRFIEYLNRISSTRMLGKVPARALGHQPG
jgi:hypothetical protein